MLELPGLNSSGNVKTDLEQVRRYLGRLVPQLERALEDLGVDGLAEQMAIRTQGLEGANGQTTSGALAGHLLDKGNPHGVTLEQLGAVRTEEYERGWLVAVCGIGIQCKWLPLEEAAGTAAGGLYTEDADLGDWGRPFTELYCDWCEVRAADLENVWAGCSAGADEEDAGSVRVFTTGDTVPACVIVKYGIGGISNG